MDFKLIGSILLVVGTSIGAGMLALPIATAQLGFAGSLILLFACWFIMVSGSLLLLEANLWMPTNSNIISMAKATIGRGGELLSWLVYLLLLYSLLCAYIAGGSELFHNLFVLSHVDVPRWLASIVFTSLLSVIVYLGIRSVDYVNRGLMLVKFASYFLLVGLLTPYISLPNLSVGNFSDITSVTTITVTITSFGFASIVPSLRVYFAGDVKKLRQAIFFGSLIPLVCYIAWDAVIMGVIPMHGEHGFSSILSSSNSTSAMVNSLIATVSTESVDLAVKVFTSICVVTSFLGVALCLTDFMSDGLRIEKKGAGHLFIHLVTFVPPLVVVLFFPNVFISALKYAGIYCLILLVLLPSWMVWQGRYVRKIATGYQARGGKPLLIALIVFAILMAARGLTG